MPPLQASISILALSSMASKPAGGYTPPQPWSMRYIRYTAPHRQRLVEWRPAPSGAGRMAPEGPGSFPFSVPFRFLFHLLAVSSVPGRAPMKAPVPRQAPMRAPGPRPPPGPPLAPRGPGRAPAPRRLLQRQAAVIHLARALAGADAFRPYPRIGDRAGVGRGPGGAPPHDDRRGREAAGGAVGRASRDALPRLRPGRQSNGTRSCCSRAGRSSRSSSSASSSTPRPLHRRDRRRRVARLRGELLGRPRARRGPEAGCGPAGRRRADGRPVRAPRRARSWRGPTTSSATGSTPSTRSCGSGCDPRSTAASSPRARARRLLVDGLHAARGQQLEPVD